MDASTPKQKTILIADDAGTLLMLAARLLKRQGYHVITLGIGTAASIEPPSDLLLSHEQLRNGDIPFAIKEAIRSSDAIVTDYHYTQGLTGLDFIEQVRMLTECKHTPVIVHSSNQSTLLNDDAFMQRAEALGITPEYVLSKDRPPELPKHVAQLLASPVREI